jgi:uroporphyrinogen III methyltransferase/synthase
MASAVAFVTGHEDPMKGEESVNWKYLSGFPGTLVILMGVGRIRDNVERLIEFGRSPDTPSAVIHRGTTPFQRGVSGRLSEIADLVEDAHIKAPAIIIIGDVVNLRDALAWYERLSLFGKKIIVTRAEHQAGELSAFLRELGAEPVELPTIEIRPPSDLKPAKRAIDRILNSSDYDVLVFTSPNGVETFFDYLDSKNFDSRALGHLKISAIGPGTKNKLKYYGIIPDVVPDKYISEELASAIINYLKKTKGEIKGKKILLFRAEGARRLLAERLGGAGAIVDDVAVYRSIVPDVKKEVLISALSSSDLITFASSSAALNLKELLEINGILNQKSGIKIPPAAAIGPITAKSARESGFDVAIEASEYTIPGLVSALVKYFGEANKK